MRANGVDPNPLRRLIWNHTVCLGTKNGTICTNGLIRHVRYIKSSWTVKLILLQFMGYFGSLTGSLQSALLFPWPDFLLSLPNNDTVFPPVEMDDSISGQNIAAAVLILLVYVIAWSVRKNSVYSDHLLFLWMTCSRQWHRYIEVVA